MEREDSIYGTATKANSRKIFLALGIAGLPIALSFAAYVWLFRSGESNNNKNKKDGGQNKKSGPPSKRVMKGIPPGLINLGNTCFVNCLLQALASLKNFCAWMEKLENDENQILLECVKEKMLVLNNKKDKDRDIFAASDVIESLSAHGWAGTAQQQDTHEFFQVLMSTLDDEMERYGDEAHGLLIEGETEMLKDVVGKACREIPVQPKPLPSPFKGMLANRMTCTNCGHQSVRFDPFDSISLRIPRFSSLTGATLEGCFADFAKMDRVDDVNCPGCTKIRDSPHPIQATFTKQMSFAKLSKCLCIHIQRSYLLPNGTSYKNNQFVRFSDIIDLTPYRYNTVAYKKSMLKRVATALEDPAEAGTKLPLRGGNNQCKTGDRNPTSSAISSNNINSVTMVAECFNHFGVQDHKKKDTIETEITEITIRHWRSLYRLKAVIVHIGEVWSGHFVTYRRAINTEDNWVYVSDEYTKLASKQAVLSNTAYLLFYERIKDI